MKLLALDTATEACSVALLIAGKQFSEFEVCPQQHSQRLLPMIDALLQQHHLRIRDLDYLCFGRGPGSFTGVRIATGMIQGLALGSGVPVVGVSTLAAMAQQAIEQYQVNNIAVAIDARMSEVYFAQFEQVDGIAKLIGLERVLGPEEAAQCTFESTDFFAGTGWQAYPELAKVASGQAQMPILYPSAASMLALAEAQISQGQACAVEDIQPVYLRDKVTWKKLPGRE